MVSKKMLARLVAVVVLWVLLSLLGVGFLKKSELAAAPVLEVPAESGVVSDSSELLLAYDSAAQVKSFEPWMIFSENFSASYEDESFSGNYQLAFPLDGPFESLGRGEIDKLLVSMLFEERAPKNVDRKSVQKALEKMMESDVRTAHEWWNRAKAEYGEGWRDEVCMCSGYFYAMPTEKSRNWMSFQQISDYRCGGNSGPDEKYYTIVNPGRDYSDDSTVNPYVMDTSAFVPGFREKIVEMITDNVIFNFYGLESAMRFGRAKIRNAVAAQFAENFQPLLTYSGVKFLFDVWALPGTCHADGRVSVIVPYSMIQEIFTEKFKKDIGL